MGPEPGMDVPTHPKNLEGERAVPIMIAKKTKISILMSKFDIRLEVLAKTEFRDLSTGFRTSKRMGSAGRNRNRPGPFLVCVFSRDTHV